MSNCLIQLFKFASPNCHSVALKNAIQYQYHNSRVLFLIKSSLDNLEHYTFFWYHFVEMSRFVLGYYLNMVNVFSLSCYHVCY